MTTRRTKSLKGAPLRIGSATTVSMSELTEACIERASGKLETPLEVALASKLRELVTIEEADRRTDRYRYDPNSQGARAVRSAAALLKRVGG